MTHPDDPELDPRQLDALLDLLEPAQPSVSLRRRVAEIPLRHPRPDSSDRWWPFRTLWRPFATLAATAALGVLVGARAATLEDGGEQGLARAEEWTDATEVALALELDLELDLGEDIAP